MNKLSDKQVQRLIALYESIKKLPKSRKNEGIKAAKQFFKDNKMTTTIDPVVALGKLYSKKKIENIQGLLNGEDKWDLYKFSYVHDKDIIKYLGIDKLKK